MRQGRGFSLIELVIVIAIIGILAAIAYPSYLSSIIKSNRAAAQGFMMEVATRQNQILLDRRAYVGAANHAELLADLSLAVPKEISDNYTVSVATPAGSPPSFTITATPVASTRQVSDGALTLTSAGAKTPAEKW